MARIVSILAGVVFLACVTASAIQAAGPPQPPANDPAIGVYVEQVPTSRGSVDAGKEAGRAARSTVVVQERPPVDPTVLGLLVALPLVTGAFIAAALLRRRSRRPVETT